MNKKGLPLRDIAKVAKVSLAYINTIMKSDPRYIPGKKGFARLSMEQRKAIASKGGKKAWENGTAHRWDEQSGREAGKKSRPTKK